MQENLPLQSPTRRVMIQSSVGERSTTMVLHFRIKHRGCPKICGHHSGHWEKHVKKHTMLLLTVLVFINGTFLKMSWLRSNSLSVKSYGPTKSTPMAPSGDLAMKRVESDSSGTHKTQAEPPSSGSFVSIPNVAHSHLQHCSWPIHLTVARRKMKWTSLYFIT